jgi:hypothetical protein
MAKLPTTIPAADKCLLKDAELLRSVVSLIIICRSRRRLARE